VSQYAVIVIDRDDPAAVTSYGPYRTLARAREVVDLFRNPQAADYRDSSEYDVFAAALRKYGE
jgi:hypothetical protein